MDDGGDYALVNANGHIVGEAIRWVAVGTEAPARANATLWAAAPELYEAAKAALYTFSELLDALGETEQRAEDEQVFLKLKAAVEKAEALS